MLRIDPRNMWLGDLVQ